MGPEAEGGRSDGVGRVTVAVRGCESRGLQGYMDLDSGRGWRGRDLGLVEPG